MCKTLLHLYLLTSIQEACINLFWEAWLWENTQIQVLNPKPIAPCWEPFSDHFWQYQRLLASSVGVCHNLLCSGNATKPLMTSCLCTSYSWVLHKLLALLTLCLTNLWDPMSPHLILDVRRYSIWRHRERTTSHQHQHLGSDKCLQGWLTQKSATVSEVTQVSKDKEDSGVGSYHLYVCYMASYFGFA